MKTKKCTVEPVPEPPPPDPCKLQRIRQKEKAGIKICPHVPIKSPTPPPSCHALCIEKIKNPPVTITNRPLVCIVKRQLPGTARCDKIEVAAAHPDLPWPGCPPQPPLPPPPQPDLCEEQKKREKIAEWKSSEDNLIEKFRTEINKQSEEDFRNTRRLTIESPYKSDIGESSQDIDSKITDLESLIKRLQDEIVDMTNETDQTTHKDNLEEILSKSRGKCKNDDGTSKDSNKTKSYIYPVIVKDGLPPTGQSKDISKDKCDTIHSSSTADLANTFAKIRHNFSLLWNDGDEGIKSEKECSVNCNESTSVIFSDIKDTLFKDNWPN
ncbi:unnamed protein product, partial [Brenthis ino]